MMEVARFNLFNQLLARFGLCHVDADNSYMEKLSQIIGFCRMTYDKTLFKDKVHFNASRSHFGMFLKIQAIYVFWIRSFHKEVELQIRLARVGVAPMVFAAWISGERGYLVQEYLQGETLQEYFDAGHKLSDQDLKKLFSLINTMHGCHVVHGDLHCGNIMVEHSNADIVKMRIIDFGQAQDAHCADQPTISTIDDLNSIMQDLMMYLELPKFIKDE